MTVNINVSLEICINLCQNNMLYRLDLDDLFVDAAVAITTTTGHLAKAM